VARRPSGVPPHVQLLVAAGEEDRVAACLAIGQYVEAGELRLERRERGAQLHAGEWRAEAEVRALAEGQVPADARSLRVELIGTGEDTLVSVGGAEVAHHPRARRQWCAVEGRIARHPPEQTLSGRLQA